MGQNDAAPSQTVQPGVASTTSSSECSAFVDLFGTPLKPESAKKDKSHKVSIAFINRSFFFIFNPCAAEVFVSILNPCPAISGYIRG